jgi:histone deacetylase 6
VLQLLLLTSVGEVAALGNDAIGTFTATNDPAIESSVPNKGEFADYYFYVKTTTAIPAGGTIVIEFPEQFNDDLGITTTPTCKTYSCTRSGRQITMTISPALPASSSVTLVVYSVLNPSAEGGSGPFELRSYKGINLLDHNKVFGVLGVAGSINSLASASVAIQSGSSKKAGEVTRYEIALKVQSTLPMWSWLRFTFSSTYSIAHFPTCEAYPINGKTLKGNLICEQVGNQVKVTGLAQEVFPDTEIGVRVSVTNPAFTGSSGSFTVETGRNSTNTVYERKTNIAGVTIEPGQITGVRFVPVDSSIVLATSKPVLYNLKFVTFNPCEQGGKVEVVFNSNFNMDSQSVFYLEYGLEDISASQTVSMSYSSSSKTMTITNFKAFANQQLSLMLLVKNPASSGDTSPLIIRTFKKDGTTTIDENTADAKLTIASTSSPDVTLSYPGGTTDQATGGAISLLFTLVPQKIVPRLGYIKIKFPAAFTVTSGSLVCAMKPKNIGLDNAAACAYVDLILTMQLYSSTAVAPAGNGDFIEGVDSYISFTAGITAPTKAGDYFFDISTYDANLNLIESGTGLVTLTAKQVAGATFDLIHTELDTISAVSLSFTPDLAVPTGATPSVTTELQGFIEVSLPTQSGGNNLFKTDLGLGISQGDAVPCLATTGLTGTLKCVLTTKPSSASNTTPAVVTVTGFTSIAASTSVVIYLAGVKAMQTTNTAAVTVLTYSKLNRIRTNINSFSDSTAAGASTAATSTTATSLNFGSTLVQGTTSLTPAATFTTTVATTATRPFLFLTFSPVHDGGYCTGATLTCTVDAVSKTCYCFSGFDAVLIDLNSVNLAAGAHTFIVSGLVQPESVPTTSEYLKLYTCGGSNAMDIITYSTALPTQTPATFTQNEVNADKNVGGSPYVTFSFLLKSSAAISSAGQIQVLFPSEYSLSASSPTPTISSDTLSPSTSSGFTSSYFDNRATLSNISAVAASTTIRLQIIGVKHPTSVSTTFTIRTLNSSARIIAEVTSVAAVALTSSWTPGTLSVTSIKPFPTNAKQKVEYAVTFTPTTSLPKGTKVSITYPFTQFANLPTSPACRVSGALNTLASCSTQANVVQYWTDEVHTSGSLTFSLMDVENFDAGTSNEFSVKIEYDSVIMDQSATGSSTLKATATAVYSPLKVTKVSFDPQNEGEVSTYLFSFAPALNVTADAYVTILFPEEFDRRLGESLTCWSAELLGSLTCTTLHERMLQVTGHSAFTACSTCSISLYVYGVINPIKRSSVTATSNVQIGFLQNNRYTESNLAAGTYAVQTAPGYNNVLETTLDNRYARYDNSMKFNMTVSTTIPTTQYKGAIWVRFPSEYELSEASLECSSSDGAPNCEVSLDRVLMDGQQATLIGNMYVALSGVPNPITEMTARSITVSTYDGLNHKILQRTYPNLNPTRFKFTYPGPLIVVNDDKPFEVRRGTMSDFIPITLDFPCALNLTLTPSSSAGVTFVPALVKLDVGETLESFRVSAPETTEPGTYYIYWVIIGDVQPNYYTPISKSKFTVNKDARVKVSIAEVPTTVRGSTSLPIYVSLDRAPDVDLTVSVTLSLSISSGFSANPAQLKFVSGEKVKSFSITTSKTYSDTSSSFDLVLSGTNVSPYVLSSTTYEFRLSLSSQSIPMVAAVFSKETGRTKFVAEVSANNSVYCYYAYALRGTPPPSFEETKRRGPATYRSTKSVYGAIEIGSNLTGEVHMGNLTAESKYSLFIWLEDSSTNRSEAVYTFDFETLVRYPAAEFSLYFVQTFLSNLEVDLVKGAISLLLSLKDWRIVEKNRETTTAPVTVISPSGGRRLTEEIRAKLTLFVVDDPGSDVYPKPKVLIELLETRKAKLSELVSRLDTTYTITGSEVYLQPCSFSVQPALYLNETDYQHIAVQAITVADGLFLAVLMETQADPGTPSSIQIESSLNALNVPVRNVSLATEAGVPFNVSFNGLSPLTEYSIYTTCGNAYPVFPELLDDTKVVSINWITDPKPDPKPLNTDSASWVVAGVVVLLALV